MAGNGQSAEIVDDGCQSDLKHFVIGEIAVGDVSGRQMAVAEERRSGMGWTWGGVGIGAVKDEVRGIEVQAFQGKFGPTQNVVGDASEDGMALFEKGVEGAAEPVVVELDRKSVV